MEREKVIRECFAIVCFLENINTNNKQIVERVLKDLRTYSNDDLIKYYKIQSDIRELRIDRIFNSQ